MPIKEGQASLLIDFKAKALEEGYTDLGRCRRVGIVGRGGIGINYRTCL
jgi:hypothetical protein